VVTRNVLEGRFKKPRELRPDISEELENVILRAMEVNPADRYPTVRDFGQAIRPFAPADAQALFMRLSSDSVFRQRSGPIVAASGPVITAQPGGTRLLPPDAGDDVGSVRALPRTEVLPEQANPRSPRRATIPESRPEPPRTNPSAPPLAPKQNHRVVWVSMAAAGCIGLVASILLFGTRARSPSTSPGNAPPEGRITPPVRVAAPAPGPPAPAPPIPVALTPPEDRPRPIAQPPAHVATHDAPAPGTAHHSKRKPRIENAAPSGDASTPHKVGNVWVIP
jgi:hypothetical protein